MPTLDQPMAFAELDSAARALRMETPEDEAFLHSLYASTRAEEMAYLPWPEEQKAAFLNMQFDLQRRHYRTYYPQGEFLIVLLWEMPAGRFYLDRSGEAFLVIDIALSPEYRRQGLGGHLLESLLDEAESAYKSVRLHVETSIRAFKFYRRLGFTPVEDQGIRWLIEWQPR
jgi:ribosomal protein S18 acetylase RimI-like enzyme